MNNKIQSRFHVTPLFQGQQFVGHPEQQHRYNWITYIVLDGKTLPCQTLLYLLFFQLKGGLQLYKILKSSSRKCENKWITPDFDLPLDISLLLFAFLFYFHPLMMTKTRHFHKILRNIINTIDIFARFMRICYIFVDKWMTLQKWDDNKW